MGIEVNNIHPSRQDLVRNKNEQPQSGNSSDSTASNKAATVQTKASSTSVTLSSIAQNLNRIEEDLKNLPEVDAGRVEELKAAIADGKYVIDNEALARKMLDLE